jgi:hypothetical protein
MLDTSTGCCTGGLGCRKTAGLGATTPSNGKRSEHGIIGVFAGAGEPQRFASRHDAFDAAVKRRIAGHRLLR